MRETLCLVMTHDNDLVLMNAIQFSYGLCNLCKADGRGEKF